MITFNDLFEYIQSAETDEVGYHYPSGEACLYRMHIYSHKAQVNIHYRKKSAFNIVFDPNCHDVSVFTVDKNECANYNRPFRYCMSDDLRSLNAIFPEAMTEFVSDTVYKWKVSQQ